MELLKHTVAAGLITIKLPIVQSRMVTKMNVHSPGFSRALDLTFVFKIEKNRVRNITVQFSKKVFLGSSRDIPSFRDKKMSCIILRSVGSRYRAFIKCNNKRTVAIYRGLQGLEFQGFTSPICIEFL